MLVILCTTLLSNFYPVNLQYSSCKYVFSIVEENSVDPDQLALREVSGFEPSVFSKKE